MSELWYTSAVDLARGIREGALSPVEVVDAHLERIDARNDEINAFETVTAERAREEAKEAERAIEEGEE